MEQDAAPAGVGITYPLHSGGPGAPPVRYYGRTARSSLTEARLPASRGFRDRAAVTGSRRSRQPPREARPGVVRRTPRWSAERRARLQKRAARRTICSPADWSQACTLRRHSALLLPSPLGGRKVQGVPRRLSNNTGDDAWLFD